METVDIITLGVVYLIIATSLALSLYAEKHWPNIDSRKIVHVGVGSFVFVWWAFQEQWVMLVFFTVPFAILLFFAMLKDNIVSNSKIGELSNKGHKTGLFLYVITINVIVAFFFNNWVAGTIGIVAMVYGDGFGSIVGRRFGKHKIIHGKSLEGSIGVFIATFIMASIIILFYGFLASNGYVIHGNYTGLIPWWGLAAVAATITSILEAACDGDYDNLVIPIAVAITMVLLGL